MFNASEIRCTASFDCVGIFRDSVLRIPCFRGVRNHRPLQQKPMLVYSTETWNTQYGITEYSNAVKTRCTADFSSVRIFRGVNADDAILCNCNYMGVRNGIKLSIRTEEKSAVQRISLALNNWFIACRDSVMELQV